MVEDVEDEDEGDEELKEEELKELEKAKIQASKFKQSQDELDEYGDMEEGDMVPEDLNEVKKQVDAMDLGHEPAALAAKMQLGDGKPIKAIHSFGLPASGGMAGMPKPPSGTKPFT